MADSFFTTPDGDWFQPTDPCRGPWDADACHAGPPAGLLARAAERAITHQRLMRLTVELVRPIPHAGFRIATDVTRAGRTVSTVTATIVDGAGRQVVTAHATLAAPGDAPELPTARLDTPRLDDAAPGPFPLAMTAHDLPAFSTGTTIMYPPGEGPDPGPTRLWMHALPLLPDEEPSGFQRICPLADCGNAISRNAEPDRAAFMNVDLTLAVHRQPVGTWFGSDSTSHWHADGLGLSDSLLFDEHGPVGRALQTLLIRPFAAGT